MSVEQCCELACESGACETCPCCAAGWCVRGADFPDPGLTVGGFDENWQSWLAIAAEHNPLAAYILALEASADDLRAEGWDRAKNTIAPLTSGWVNPYRKDADGGDG